ncbi:MAG: DegV family protein [Lachnospiraceae bacterium]|nr:DegV family protein [Lachnospiraceae bacterium]
MSNFIVTADTTMDLPLDLIKKYDIHPIASYVSLGGEDMPDWPDVTQQDLFAYVAKSGELPKTSAANPYDYEEFFKKIRETDDRPIIHIAKTSGASSCFENAVQASREVSDVYCVDSWGLGSGTGLVAIRAATSEISDPKVLCEDLNEYRTRIDCSFVIETVDYLFKGGRCSGLAAIGANILKLRPEILLTEGKMHAGRKFRGRYDKVLYEFTAEKLGHPEQFEPDYLFINHTLQDPQLLNRLVSYVKGLNYFKEVIDIPVCAAVATHCGPGTFGFHPVRKKA